MMSRWHLLVKVQHFLYVGHFLFSHVACASSVIFSEQNTEQQYTLLFWLLFVLSWTLQPFLHPRGVAYQAGPDEGHMLYEVMVVDKWNCEDLRILSWHHNTPSIKCTRVHRPDHSPTATMGRSIHSADVGKQLTHTRYAHTVWAEILWLRKPAAAEAECWVAGVRPSWRWRGMDKVLDLWVQLMKNWSINNHVEFIHCLFSVTCVVWLVVCRWRIVETWLDEVLWLTILLWLVLQPWNRVCSQSFLVMWPTESVCSL